MIGVVVCGALGQMGRVTCSAVAQADDMELLGAVGPGFKEVSGTASTGAPGFSQLEEALEALAPAVVVDFTRPSVVFKTVMTALKAGAHVVVGTTGLTADQIEILRSQAEKGSSNVFVAPNFAIGAVLLMELAQRAARYLPNAEIIELHHDKKVDSPSGTALRTAELMAKERRQAVPPAAAQGKARGEIVRDIPIHSVRLPGLVASQEVIFGAPGQTLSLRHDALNRECFMPGVLLAIRKIAEHRGLTVGLEHLL